MPQDETATTASTAGANGGDPTTSLDLPAGMFRSGDRPEETVLTMYRPSEDHLRNVTAKFTEVDGRAVFEGDIVLGTPAQARGEEDLGERGLGIVGAEFRWKRGVVPYVTTEALRPKVEAAIAHWQQHTPFRFRKRTNQKDYISFEDHGGCWSNVGRQGGKQVISIGSGCTLGSVIHEIGHALGLWHEQSRSDRDEFVEIIFANISPDHRHNFDQHILDGDDLGAYDYDSIMHYPATAFSINGQPTIRAKGGQPIGQRNGLSQGDIAAIRMMYKDLNWDKGGAATSPAAAAAGT